MSHHDATPPSLSLVHLTRPPLTPPAGDARAPLLLLLHGVGSNERDLFSFAPELDPRFRIVSARGPLTRAPGSYAWFSVRFLPNNGFEIEPEQLQQSRDRLVAVLGEAVAAYDADPARVYLFGFSQGAIMSLALALTQPQALAGVAAFSGRIPSELTPELVAPERTAGLPVFLAHGRSDAVIALDWAHRARPILEAQHVALTYREFDGGHTIPQPIFDAANRWLGDLLDAPTPWAAPRG